MLTASLRRVAAFGSRRMLSSTAAGMSLSVCVCLSVFSFFFFICSFPVYRVSSPHRTRLCLIDPTAACSLLAPSLAPFPFSLFHFRFGALLVLCSFALFCHFSLCTVAWRFAPHPRPRFPRPCRPRHGQRGAYSIRISVFFAFFSTRLPASTRTLCRTPPPASWALEGRLLIGCDAVPVVWPYASRFCA